MMQFQVREIAKREPQMSTCVYLCLSVVLSLTIKYAL